MSSSPEFVVIPDRPRTKHPFLAGAMDGYYNCATCGREPGHHRHRVTRNGAVFVVFDDAATSARPMAVPLTIVNKTPDGRKLAASVRARLSAVRGEA